jgi:hypothetical protein
VGSQLDFKLLKNYALRFGQEGCAQKSINFVEADKQLIKFCIYESFHFKNLTYHSII